MVNLIKKHHIIILFIIFHILIHKVWLFDASYLTHGDSGIYTEITQNGLLVNFFTLYNNNYTGHVDVGGLPSRIIILIHGLFANFNLYYNISWKIIYAVPFVIIAPLGLYVFLKKHTNFKNLAIFVSLSIFFFNTYTITLQTGHQLLLLATALSWFVFYKLFDLIKTPNLYNSTVLAIYSFIIITYDFRIFYLNTIIIAIIVIINLIVNINPCKRYILYLFTSYLIISILNFYWFYPLFKLDLLTNNVILQREIFGSDFFNIKNSLTLNHPFWTGSKPAQFIVQEISLYKYLIPFIFILSIMFSKKTFYLVAFTIIGLVGIFFSKQTSIPLGFFYELLFNQFPGFSAFREASKFYYLVTISYSIVIPYYINSIYFNNKRLSLLLTVITLSLFFYNLKPIVTKDIGTMFVPRHVPDDYRIFNDFLSENNNIFRVISLPRESKWLGYSNKISHLSSIYILDNSVWRLILSREVNNNITIEEKIISMYNKDYSNNLFDNSNIKYVVVPIRDVSNDDNFFIYYGETRNSNIRDWYIRELDNVKWLEKREFGFEELVVYENRDYKDRIYLSKEIETIYKNIPSSNVDFTQITPAEYKIKVNNLNDLEYLNFVESYDINWKLRLGDFNWLSVLYVDNYFFGDYIHSRSELGFNSFEISKDFIKSNFDKSMYTENPDGSINIELTLYFKPQSHFYLGIIVSSLTLIGCLLYIFIYIINKKVVGVYKNRFTTNLKKIKKGD